MSCSVREHGARSKRKNWEITDAVKTQFLNRNVYSTIGFTIKRNTWETDHKSIFQKNLDLLKTSLKGI